MQDVRATLLDTRGPEIRSGKLQNDHSGHETITLTKGDTITLRTDPKYAEEGSTVTDLFINYDKLHKCLHPGMKVLLDDGAVVLTVTDVESSKEYYGAVTCSIDNSGDLRSRAGVNLPLAETDLPAMSDKDKADIKYGMSIDVDYVAASFVQTADGVREIRRHMKECAKELGWDDKAPLPLIISKIESASALKHFDEILKESDGIMVARGDLGVEVRFISIFLNAYWLLLVNNIRKSAHDYILSPDFLFSVADPHPTGNQCAKGNGSGMQCCRKSRYRCDSNVRINGKESTSHTC